MVYIHAMQAMHDALRSFDLNLLLVLDALLAEKHVTRAAQRLRLTQSATSHALARLRDLLDDPLLVRGAGGSLVLTPRAAELEPAVRRALDALDTAIRGAPTFDPANARRSFRLAMTDFAELILLPPLV